MKKNPVIVKLTPPIKFPKLIFMILSVKMVLPIWRMHMLINVISLNLVFFLWWIIALLNRGISCQIIDRLFEWKFQIFKSWSWYIRRRRSPSRVQFGWKISFFLQIASDFIGWCLNDLTICIVHCYLHFVLVFVIHWETASFDRHLLSSYRTIFRCYLIHCWNYHEFV